MPLQYRYRAYMPIDGTRRIVHIKSESLDVPFQLISVTAYHGGYRHHHDDPCERFKYPGHVAHVTALSTLESDVKEAIARTNGHDKDAVEITMVPDSMPANDPVRSNSGPRRRHLRRLRDESELPPRGWIAD